MSDNQIRLCYLDLDDTLMPTSWLREMYYVYKSNNYKSLESDIDIYKNLINQMNIEIGNDFETILCNFLELIYNNYNYAIIVTNARSMTWINTIISIFPKFAETLNKYDIKIIKTDPKSSAEPSSIFEVDKYVRYWSNAKFNEFLKIINDIERYGVIEDANKSNCKMKERGKEPNNIEKETFESNAVNMDLTCIGDNSFEHIAFVKICAYKRPNGYSRIIKCTNDLHPIDFVLQLSTMADLIKSWWAAEFVGNVIKLPQIYSNDESYIKKFNNTINSNVKYLIWTYENSHNFTNKSIHQEGRNNVNLKKLNI